MAAADRGRVIVTGASSGPLEFVPINGCASNWK
jgi:hypothetical protein